MQLMDTHVHLEDSAYAADRPAVLERAQQAGVRLLVNAGSTAEANSALLSSLAAQPEVWGAVGLHPHEFTISGEADWAVLQEQLTQEKIVAFGEMGLDYHVFPDSPAPDREAQQAGFVKQLQLARLYELPLIIHIREAFPDALRLLKQYAPYANRGVLHCYAGGQEYLEQVLELGFLLGIGGPITYPKSTDLARVVSEVSGERLLLETDAPYLPPQSRRGQRNEPAFLLEIAQACARLRNTSVEGLAEQTWNNACRLFKLGAENPGTIVYEIQGHLYVNLTNRCSANCVFCPRHGRKEVQQHELTLRREPTAAEVIAAIGDPGRFSEIVFCGFGEPTLRLPVLLDIARALKKKGAKIRVDTNGHADAIFQRDILPECQGLIDEWSVSLNSADAVQYQKLVRPAARDAHAHVQAFIGRAVQAGFRVTVSAVELPEVDTRRLAEVVRQLGARYRGRVPQRLGEPEANDSRK